MSRRDTPFVIRNLKIQHLLFGQSRFFDCKSKQCFWQSLSWDMHTKDSSLWSELNFSCYMHVSSNNYQERWFDPLSIHYWWDLQLSPFTPTQDFTFDATFTRRCKFSCDAYCHALRWPFPRQRTDVLSLIIMITATRTNRKKWKCQHDNNCQLENVTFVSSEPLRRKTWLVRHPKRNPQKAYFLMLHAINSPIKARCVR